MSSTVFIRVVFSEWNSRSPEFDHSSIFMLLSQNRGGRSATMTWSLFVNLTGYGAMFVGIILLVWSLARKEVSVLGLGLLIAGFIVHLLAAFVG